MSVSEAHDPWGSYVCETKCSRLTLRHHDDLFPSPEPYLANAVR